MMSELSAADVAAVTGNNNGGFGNNGDGWWIILLLLALGGRGFGGGYGGGDNVNAGFAWQGIDNGIRGVQQGICDATYALNNSIMSGFHGVDNAICTLGYQTQQGFNTLGYQMKDCCCETQRMIERGFCDLNNNMNTNTRAILDYLTNEKIETLRDENQTLRLAASQAKQNNYLIEQLRPSPIPAYQVQNPYCCNTSCGCGGFGGNF